MKLGASLIPLDSLLPLEVLRCTLIVPKNRQSWAAVNPGTRTMGLEALCYK